MIIWGHITKAISKFSGIHMKILMTFFIENRTKNPKIHMESKKTPNCQSSLNQKNIAGSITIPDFKKYYRHSNK
jgi:hypothetical protein